MVSKLPITWTQEGQVEAPESSYRLRRKFPLGSHFDRLSPEDVRRVFEAHAAGGKLSYGQFEACLKQMNVNSSFSVRRLFQLFDNDQSGFVELHEFASSFLLRAFPYNP